MGTYAWLHGTVLEETLETTTKSSKAGKDEQCWWWSALPHTHTSLTVTISERSPHSPPVMERCVVHPFAQLPAPALPQLCSTCNAKSVLLVTDLIHLGIRLPLLTQEFDSLLESEISGSLAVIVFCFPLRAHTLCYLCLQSWILCDQIPFIINPII